jgi:hypothetical protein
MQISRWQSESRAKRGSNVATGTECAPANRTPEGVPDCGIELDKRSRGNPARPTGVLFNRCLVTGGDASHRYRSGLALPPANLLDASGVGLPSPLYLLRTRATGTI